MDKYKRRSCRTCRRFAEVERVMRNRKEYTRQKRQNTEFIYILKESDTEEIKYVGRTIDPKKRLKNHMVSTHLEPPSQKNNWIKSVIARDANVILEILEEVPREKASEKEYEWITKLTKEGHDLKNTHLSIDEEYKDAISRYRVKNYV